jgi:hypothetical protein
MNAQVNSAKNLLERSSLREFHPHLPKKQVLKVLIKRHLERLKGCKSAPLDILKGNPYYREFFENILNPRQGLPTKGQVSMECLFILRGTLFSAIAFLNKGFFSEDFPSFSEFLTRGKKAFKII